MAEPRTYRDPVSDSNAVRRNLLGFPGLRADPHGTVAGYARYERRATPRRISVFVLEPT